MKAGGRWPTAPRLPMRRRTAISMRRRCRRSSTRRVDSRPAHPRAAASSSARSIADTQSQCTPRGAPTRSKHSSRRPCGSASATSRSRWSTSIPGLPAIEFYERERVSLARGARSRHRADASRSWSTILREDQAGFAPYIHYDDHMPLDQWRELNHSPRWSAFHFYEKGQPIEDRCRRAPATMAALSRLPQARGRAALALARCTRCSSRRRSIPPHTGVANFRLVVHLPLIVPPGCGFRVGGETREWRIGEALGVRRHDRARGLERQRPDRAYIFICDVWSPRAVAGGARGDRRHHRRDRRLQRHAADGARLNGRRADARVPEDQEPACAGRDRAPDRARRRAALRGGPRIESRQPDQGQSAGRPARSRRTPSQSQIVQRSACTLARVHGLRDAASAIAPPLLCRYEPGMKYGAHADAALIQLARTRLRSDLSCTIFVTDPASYEGGELRSWPATRRWPSRARPARPSCIPRPAARGQCRYAPAERLVGDHVHREPHRGPAPAHAGVRAERDRRARRPRRCAGRTGCGSTSCARI